ncbi:hypothetical protein LAM19_23890, partial [Mycobacterium tuberculosis]|nr:hypothetical protein [Mycobacterium tuberculosis]
TQQGPLLIPFAIGLIGRDGRDLPLRLDGEAAAAGTTRVLDFTDTGILDVFVDEAHVQMREQTIGGKNGTQPGLMRGVELANTF